MLKKYTAPELDNLLSVFELGTFNPGNYDSKVKEKLNELYELLDKIKPLDGGDDLKILYFGVERGTIENYGDYGELKEYGAVSNYTEFEINFKEEYPDDLCWYRMVTSRYQNYRTISINFKNIIYADMDSESSHFENESLQELLGFIIYKVNECIVMLENNIYNEYISNNLSYKNRFGVIKRSDYWKLYPEVKEELLKEISQEEINEFIKNADVKVRKRIQDMTSGKYFECVRLAYENNNYDIGNLSDKELYLKYADGRDEGLSGINSDDSNEFNNWYHDKNRFGGHPWEIMRGHSFYRVNLYISHDEEGYYLSLDGSRILRKVEIAKIYLILKKNNIPVQIYNVDVIKEAFRGSDYIGIVPDIMLPIECGSYFKDYKPLEFINIRDEKLLDYVTWESLEKVYLK